MIRGIQNSQPNGIYSMQSQMNEMKLALAMSKNQTVPPVRAINSSTNSGKLKDLMNQDSIKFVKQYQSQNTELMTDANALRSANKSSVVSQPAANTTDSTVATAQLNSSRASGSYTLDVMQVASSQQNISQAVSATAAPTAGGSMTISNAKGNFTFNANSKAKSNLDQYADIANQINKANMGVVASVTQKDGKVSMSLTGTQTGAGQGFVAAGSFAEQSKLDTMSRTAQDAIVSVQKTGSKLPASTVTSATNTVQLDNSKISATLTGVGKTTVSVGADAAKTTKALNKLVSSYNDTLKLLSDNSNRGAGVTRQRSGMEISSSMKRNLEQIGISQKSDGTLEMDTKKFQSALQNDPSKVTDIVSGENGFAQKVFDAAVTGSQTSTASLLGTSGGVTSSLNNRISTEQDPMNFMSAYSKNGVYNLSNFYAVGVLMNLNA